LCALPSSAIVLTWSDLHVGGTTEVIGGRSRMGDHAGGPRPSGDGRQNRESDRSSDPASDAPVSTPGSIDGLPVGAAVSAGPSTIIVADDDHDVRGFFRVALERAGFDVLTASNGRRALEIARQSPAAVMLLDLHMPGLDGIDTLRALRAEPGLRTMPVIMVTGSLIEADRIGGLDGGADDVLIKPVSVTELVARIRAQIRGRAVWTEEREAARHYRQRLAAFLPELPPGASLEDLAMAVAEQLPAILDVNAVAILAFDEGTARVIAAGGVLTDRYVSGRRLNPAQGVDIARRAEGGPWHEVSAARGARLDLAYVPFSFGGGPHPIGCLVFACADTEAAGSLWLRIGDLSDATDLIVSALRPAIEHAETADTALLGLRAIIEHRLFAIHFQPIVRLESRVVVGVEALTRFADGTRPDVRFAEATRIGMGRALERATIARAIEAASSLPPDLFLSLNLSPDVLCHDQALVEIIAGAGRSVVVELTEHERIDDYDEVRAALGRLGPRVRLAVDDAGSGYASLRHILNLRPAFMKLDMEWVHGIDGDPIRRSLVWGLAHFGDETSCELIAEGIETEAERAALMDLGVRLGQGFLLGRPQPAPGADELGRTVG
jgi:EAL domain-containing protein (putative c-di-GMP-specific phosphodiesterase class I)/DNA-binding NarL/FixJ family response regulator